VAEALADVHVTEGENDGEPVGGDNVEVRVALSVPACEAVHDEVNVLVCELTVGVQLWLMQDRLTVPVLRVLVGVDVNVLRGVGLLLPVIDRDSLGEGDALRELLNVPRHDCDTDRETLRVTVKLLAEADGPVSDMDGDMLLVVVSVELTVRRVGVSDTVTLVCVFVQVIDVDTVLRAVNERDVEREPLNVRCFVPVWV